MKMRRFHITWRLIGSLKSGAFFGMTRRSSANVDHEIAVPIDMGGAARAADSRRLALLANSRALHRLIDRKLGMSVDGRFGVGAHLTEVGGAHALESVPQSH